MNQLIESRVIPWLIPFLARAQAHRLWPQLGFKDPAAELLLEQLDIADGAFSCVLAAQKTQVARCRWMDAHLHLWLKRYPRSLCIEWGAGLSTRFWRLSNQQDWPRCRWLEIDDPELHTWKDTLLPRCDNRMCIGCPNFYSNCPGLTGLAWQPGEALVLLLYQSNLSNKQSEQICHLLESAGSAFIVLCHPAKYWPPMLQHWLSHCVAPLEFKTQKGWGPFRREVVSGWLYQRAGLACPST